MCDMVGQFIQKKEEEKQIEEVHAAKARYWKIFACYDDDDDDYTIAITHNEPGNSLSMGDEHLDTIPATESDEFIKSSVENLVPNPSESEGKYECDMPACEIFTTFSNILFDADYDFHSSDDQSFSDEDFPKEIYSNPLNILILEELLSNNSLAFPENESFHFDIPSSSRLPTKPPDSNTRILNVKMMGDISEHKVPMPKLMFTHSTIVPNQEKSPDLLSHWAMKLFSVFLNAR
nr:hypothetical protein [Tanacetum cinerariifolium]